jgi:ribosomal protein S4
MISHKHILVNGKIINSNGFILSPGDHITVNEKSFDILYKKVFYSLKNYLRLKDKEENLSITNFLDKHSLALIPNYLEVNYTILEGMFLYLPTIEEIKYPSYIDYNLILEFYKHKVKL